VYDIFDPKLSDLRKLDVARIKGRTFWDYANNEGLHAVVVHPMMLYPAWEISDIMVSRSPIDRRIDWIRTEIDVDVYPRNIRDKYAIPNTYTGLWGGFPGLNHLDEWVRLGQETLNDEQRLGLELLRNEPWDLFFIYFNVLDIIQHRLWRFFDTNDPLYQKNQFSTVIVDYYKHLDSIVGSFIAERPDVQLLVLSDHGHRSRPITTVNINTYLQMHNVLVPNRQRKHVTRHLRKTVLEIISRLGLEHVVMKLVVKSPRLTKASKSIYSSGGSIDRDKSTAFLSTFAGIKSYPDGGIEIQAEHLSAREYKGLRDALIGWLEALTTARGEHIVQWARKREDLYPGTFTAQLYPDIVFELQPQYGVGWDVQSDLFGKAYDHPVASGGHAPDAVLLMRNIDKDVARANISLMDVAPTIVDLLGADSGRFEFDGASIFEPRRSG
jgi:predicted AlkP superfamily phosphohydrolase/phosphomutase